MQPAPSMCKASSTKEQPLHKTLPSNPAVGSLIFAMHCARSVYKLPLMPYIPRYRPGQPRPPKPDPKNALEVARRMEILLTCMAATPGLPAPSVQHMLNPLLW